MIGLSLNEFYSFDGGREYKDIGLICGMLGINHCV